MPVPKFSINDTTSIILLRFYTISAQVGCKGRQAVDIISSRSKTSHIGVKHLLIMTCISLLPRSGRPGMHVHRTSRRPNSRNAPHRRCRDLGASRTLNKDAPDQEWTLTYFWPCWNDPWKPFPAMCFMVKYPFAILRFLSAADTGNTDTSWIQHALD
jgi:hypothetical protein